MTAWSEGKIAAILARNTFKADLCVLPNCVWTGHEIDLLVVTRDLRIVDVEIKISRADLKADNAKAKWWHQPAGHWEGEGHGQRWVRPPREPVEWPTRTWKHYYALPADIWRDELVASVQSVSGVLVVHASPRGRGYMECVKRAKPCRDAAVLSSEQVVAIARLASLRMWDAYADVDRIRDDSRQRSALVEGVA